VENLNLLENARNSNFSTNWRQNFFSSVLNGGKFKLNPLKRELKAADRCRSRRQVTKRRRPALHVPTPAGAGEREEEKIDKIFAFVRRDNGSQSHVSIHLIF
jgi:hypothetical protein